MPRVEAKDGLQTLTFVPSPNFKLYNKDVLRLDVSPPFFCLISTCEKREIYIAYNIKIL
jgi:hypothetical protein